MQIDLNTPEQLTPQQVRQLLAEGNDRIHNQLRVTRGGIAYLSQITGGRELDGLLFRLETWPLARAAWALLPPTTNAGSCRCTTCWPATAQARQRLHRYLLNRCAQAKSGHD